LLYFLLTWLAVLPRARTSFFLGRDGEDRWLAFFLMAVSATSQDGSPIAALPQKNSNPGRKAFMVVGQVGLGSRLLPASSAASALGSSLLLAAAFWGISASQYWAITQTLAGTEAVQVDRAGKLLR